MYQFSRKLNFREKNDTALWESVGLIVCMDGEVEAEAELGGALSIVLSKYR